jgi:hypothetical protein
MKKKILLLQFLMLSVSSCKDAKETTIAPETIVPSRF